MRYERPRMRRESIKGLLTKRSPSDQSDDAA